MSGTRQSTRLDAEQEPFLVARSLATTYSHGHVIDTHAHGWHQLLYAGSGAMTVSADHSSWMTPPGKAVVIPARARHSIRMWGSVAMRSVYVAESVRTGAFAASRCRVISVTPLLREAILRVVELSALDSRRPTDARLMAVLLDEIDAPPVEPLMLLLPADPRAVPVAQRILADPASDETLGALARRHGVAGRTLERLFRTETGLSLGLWRQKARMLASIRALAEKRSVTDAAFDAGYSSVSAFINAFKHTFGCTPGSMAFEGTEGGRGPA
jgi:AraC-like DNA-binding protein